MDSNLQGKQGIVMVIMGVSGSGKSTVAEMLAKSIPCSFIEADDFHSQSNKEKMSKGIPLTDEDRIPWLESLRDAIREKTSRGETVTLSCSALQKNYREILRSADPSYNCGDYTQCSVRFIWLSAPAKVIADRIERRLKEGKHFMPPTLLDSQLNLLQIDDSEGIIKVDATQSLEDIVHSILALKTQLGCFC